MALSEEDRRRIEEEEFRKEARERAQRQLDAGGSSSHREAPSVLPQRTGSADAGTRGNYANGLRSVGVGGVVVAFVGLVLTGNVIAFIAALLVAICVLLVSLSFKPK